MLIIAPILGFIALLTLYRPEPLNLRHQKHGYLKNLLTIKASLLLGLSFMCVFVFSSGFLMHRTPQEISSIWGMHKTTFLNGSYWQIITNNFIHSGPTHLYPNVFCIAILTLYERRVGASRYLMVFLLSALGSSLYSLMIDRPEFSIGASAGIFGLVTAYFIDYPKLKGKKWLKVIVIILILAAVSTNDMGVKINTLVSIDHWSHFFGAITAILYTKIFPLRHKPPNEDIHDFIPTKHIKFNSCLILVFTTILTFYICFSIGFSGLKYSYNHTFLLNEMELLNKKHKDCHYKGLNIDIKKTAYACAELVKNGDAAAMHTVSMILALSKVSREAQVEMIKKAAHKDHPYAQFKYGEILEFEQKQLAEAYRWYKKSASLGNPLAQLKMGDYNLKHKADASKWYAQAAQQGIYNANSLKYRLFY